MILQGLAMILSKVALFTRAWIEISKRKGKSKEELVALFTRAWIEIDGDEKELSKLLGRPLHEGVD